MVASSSSLSPREWEVLELLALGRHYAEVADALTVSPFTVESHARHIRQKLGAVNAAHAVWLAMVPSSCGSQDA